MALPTPWLFNSVRTVKPLRRTAVSTTLPILLMGRPARTTEAALQNANSAHSRSSSFGGGTGVKATVSAASAM